MNKDKTKKVIISKCIDTDAMSTNEIIDNFCSYCSIMDGTKITYETRKKIQNLLEEEPIIRILCTGMYSSGYDSF